MKDKKIDKYIKEQSSKLTKGLIDRRQFMMSVLATGVTLPIALSLADKAVAATPKKADILDGVMVRLILQIHLILQLIKARSCKLQHGHTKTV